MKNPGIIMHKASKTQIMPRFLPHPMACFSTGSPPPSTTLLCTGIFFWPFPGGLWHYFHTILLGLQLEPV